MLAKKVTFHEEARLQLVRGINAVADAVRVTLGPRGRNVVLERDYGAPQIVNDGVTIAREVTLADAEQNTGARLLIEVASKTDLKAGDGTTTSAVLCQAIVKEGMKAVSAGRNPIFLKKGIDAAVHAVISWVLQKAKKVEGIKDIRAIATISAGNDEEVGGIIASAFEKVGENGNTTVEESQELVDTIEYSEGMEVDRGYISPYFVKDAERQSAEIVNARVLITDAKIANVQDVVAVLEQAVQGKTPLLIISDDVTGEALSTLVVNKMRGVLDVVAIKCPGFGNRRKEYLEDIAVLTGGTYFAEDLGIALNSATIDQLGYAERIVVTKDKTTIVAGSGNEDAIRTRIKQIEREIETCDSDFDREKLVERKAKLGGGIARIKIGAATETELKDKKLRYEDALNATKAAIEAGVVPGGGVTLLHARKILPQLEASMETDDERAGVQIIYKALEYPIQQIAVNAGLDGEVVLSNVDDKPFGFGYNAKTEVYEDLYAAGVVDPAKVTWASLENAASVASMVLTTDCIITDIVEDKKDGDDMGDLPGEEYM